MVKVYLVLIDDGPEGLRDPAAIFSTQEKAEDWIQIQKGLYDFVAVEFTVDAV